MKEPDDNPSPPSSSISRRQFVMSSAAAALATSALPGISGPSAGRAIENKVGVSVASYYMRWRSGITSTKYPGWNGALEMMEHCHQIGAGGVQAGVHNWTMDFAKKVRARHEELNMFLEGQIRLPQNPNEVGAFENDVRCAREAGALILRTACLSGRRYENFQTREAYAAFKQDAIHSIELAEAVCRKHQMKLAIENHKDWRSEELVAILKHLGSEWVGVTLDNGNNMALVEDPMEVVEVLAPYAFTTHFKDMGIEEYEDGFLLSEVPFGQGFFDLPAMISVMRKHNPDITFNLEMITRDPLEIPCLNKSYWATYDDVPAEELASMLRLVRDHKPEKPLQRVSQGTPEQQLGWEEENNVACIVYAREKLGL